MRVLGKRRIGVLSLVLVGSILGTASGFWVGRALLLRSAKIALSDYAELLTHQGDETTDELNRIFVQLNASPFAFCSDQELSALQAQTFRSRYLKDIGRTLGGKLDCSAFLGRLTHPFIEGTPTLVLANGTHVYINVPVMLASYRGDRATVIESGGVDAVLSPDAFDRWERPHTRYAIVLVNRAMGQISPIAGSMPQVEPAWVSSQGLKTLSGTVYSTRCSARNPVCAVTAQSISDIWGWSRATQVAYSTMGGVAGFSLGVALALLYLQTTQLSSQLHRAIRRNSRSLRLLYQPIVDITTRRWAGCEALIRWSDQDGTPVGPDMFVRLAEEKGFIAELTALVIRRATLELGEHLRRYPDFTVSINVAASDLGDDQFAPLLKKQVHQAGISPRQVALELTERSTANVVMISTAIHNLHNDGYKVHIDDFGTGFSSLSYLGQLDVDAIKVDRAFTRTIGTDAALAPILPLMISMAESLQVEVIVEGVETQMQTDYLEATGKHLRLQGTYFGWPMTAAALTFSYEHDFAAPDVAPVAPPAWPGLPAGVEVNSTASDLKQMT